MHMFGSGEFDTILSIIGGIDVSGTFKTRYGSLMKPGKGRERRRELRSPSWYRWLVKNLREKEK